MRDPVSRPSLAPGPTLVAALAAAVLLVPARPARAESLGFKLRVPIGWIDLGPEAPPENFVRAPEAAAADAREGRYAGYAVNPTRPGETIAASQVPTGRADTAKFIRDIEQSVQAKWSDRGPFGVEGQVGAFLVGTIQAEKRSKPERQLLVAVRTDGEHHVLVTCTAPADKFAAVRPLFEETVRGSFARAVVDAFPRAQLGERFAAAVRATAQGLEVTRADAGEVRVRAGRGSAVEIRVSMADVNKEVEMALAAGQPRGRAETQVFERYIEQLRAQQAPVVPERERVLPRLVTAAFLQRSGWMGPRQAIGTGGTGTGGAGGDTGLVAVYVIEGAADTWVGTAQLPALGVAGPQLHQLAVDNLRSRDAETVRKAVRAIFDGMGPQVLRGERGAARLLLVGEALREGERVAAMVPDRDTLIVGPLNAAPGELLRAVAAAPGGDPLSERVLVVSRGTITPRP